MYQDGRILRGGGSHSEEKVFFSNWGKSCGRGDPRKGAVNWMQSEFRKVHILVANQIIILLNATEILVRVI